MSLSEVTGRVWNARAWILAWWVVSLVIALHGGMQVAATAAAGMRGYIGAADGHLFAASLELLTEEPAVAAAIASAVRASMVLGAVLWLVGTPIAYAVMAGQRSVGAVSARTWMTFLPMVVQTIYVGVLRAVLLVIVGITPANGKVIAALVVLPLWLGTVAVLDEARALAAERSVSGQRGRFHPRIVLDAGRSVLSQPLRTVLGSASWLVAVAWIPFAIYVAIQSAGAPLAVWGLRAGALLPLVLGFARIGLYAKPTAEPT